jgi:hypothetical protein
VFDAGKLSVRIRTIRIRQPQQTDSCRPSKRRGLRRQRNPWRGGVVSEALALFGSGGRGYNLGGQCDPEQVPGIA